MELLFSDEFVLSLPDDWEEAALKILTIWYAAYRNTVSSNEDRILAVETISLLKILASARNEDAALQPLLGTKQLEEMRSDFIRRVEKKKNEAREEHFKFLLNTSFCYKFSQADVERLQFLINELRDLISNRLAFEDGHKSRLLKRLEALQQELHKRQSNLDKLWGLIGDAGVALGKFGRDAKPLVDRIKEIAEITWRAQADAEGLPTSARPAFLGHDDIHQTHPTE